MSSFDTPKTLEAYEILVKSGLFTKEELKDAKLWIHEYDVNPYTMPGVSVVGLSPMKAGEVLGINGKALQAKCKDFKIKAWKDWQGWWTIPVTEVIKLRMEQNEKTN